jgi:hydrogenase expression/formation protein HypE
MSSEPATSTSGALPFGNCPVPSTESERILLAHGGGGRLSAQLIERTILPALRNPILEMLDDQAVLRVREGRIAFTTDSYVVTPLFFPGGDIGELAVNGTVNDLSVGGAQPLALSLAFILEEGLPIDDFRRVVESVRHAAERAGVPVVTGDTKVVGRGAADGLFINTSGIGVIRSGIELSSRHVRPGDAVIVSGPIGDHGIAILSRREGLSFDGDVVSDTAPLNGLVDALLAAYPGVHAMRDPTRGGVAATLSEIATRQRVGIEVDERAVPVRDAVRGACEILGLDPLLVANEGKVVVFVPEEGVAPVLVAMRSHPLGSEAVRIGSVTEAHPGIVVLQTPIGGRRILELPMGEPLPRIC